MGNFEIDHPHHVLFFFQLHIWSDFVWEHCKYEILQILQNRPGKWAPYLLKLNVAGMDAMPQSITMF